jgi:uncharacterized protein (UPF0332 family)
LPSSDNPERKLRLSEGGADATLLEGLTFKSHKETIGAFGRLFAKRGRIDPKFQRYRIEAEELREVADYGTHAQVSSTTASKTVDRAAEFVTMAENFLEETGGSIE